MNRRMGRGAFPVLSYAFPLAGGNPGREPPSDGATVAPGARGNRCPAAVQQVDAGNAGPAASGPMIWPGRPEGTRCHWRMAAAIDLCAVAFHRETAMRAGLRRPESVNAGRVSPARDSANSV